MKIDQKARLVEAINSWVEAEGEESGFDPWIHSNFGLHAANAIEAMLDAMEQSQNAVQVEATTG